MYSFGFFVIHPLAKIYTGKHSSLPDNYFLLSPFQYVGYYFYLVMGMV